LQQEPDTGNGQFRIAFDFMVSKQLKQPIPDDDFAIPRPLQKAMLAHPEDSRGGEDAISRITQTAILHFISLSRKAI
jgi:hypothetical protein